jgi:hypothetical protein
MLRNFAVVFASCWVAVSGQARADIIYRAGNNSGPTPQEYFLETDRFANPDYPSGYQLTSRADAGGLYSKMGVKGTGLDNFFTSIDVNDLVFSSSNSNASGAWVRGGGNLSGGFSAPNGNGTAILSLYLNGAGDGLAFSTNDGETIDQGVFVDAWVPFDTPVRFTAILELRMSSLPWNISWAIFDDSFEFDPLRVFDLPAGVTVNSASWGIVNNRLVSAVPEPAAGLYLTGLSALLLTGRRRRRSNFSPKSGKQLPGEKG